MENNRENICPCCKNHCPSDRLQCRRGRAYFGASDGEENREGRGERGGRGSGTEDEVIVMIRRCGHYLHHNAAGEDGGKLSACLSDKEKKELTELLKKCLESWEGGRGKDI